jgi:glycosyltransferase involved in cell wall biosynthesis
MYCGSCLHGNTLATALHRLGEDVVLAPVYTPLRTDEESAGIGRLALGGINVFLQERWPVLRRLPRFIRRLLDRPGLVAWAARRATATRPEALGQLTVSVLRGEEGRQCTEIEELIGWLEREVRPDLVHLSNVMLAGLSRPLVRRLGAPVVSTLSGEDVFLEKLPPPYHEQARVLLRERAADLAAMVAMNHYCADFMAGYLAVPRQRIHVIPPGLNLDGHGKKALVGKQSAFTIGYLARVCHDKGLHHLVDALGLLAADGDLPPVRVRAAGYLDKADRGYLADVLSQAARAGLADRFEYMGELNRPQKIAFLEAMDVLCVPTIYRESKGLYLLEAWANGVPAVLPGHGAFPEMVADTGGGVLYEPGDPARLATALRRMILEPHFAAECGRRAQEAVHQRYTAELMARRTVEWYKSVAG